MKEQYEHGSAAPAVGERGAQRNTFWIWPNN